MESSYSWCEPDIITLDASQPFQADYYWSTGSNDSVIEINTPEVYSINVISTCASLHHEITVVEDPSCDVQDEIFIPTVFSPNSDNINDVFTVFFGSDLDITGVQCSVFDRWGNMVFRSEDFPFGWDGNFNGNAMSPGVYVYLIKVGFSTSGEEKEKVFYGDITLIR